MDLISSTRGDKRFCARMLTLMQTYVWLCTVWQATGLYTNTTFNHDVPTFDSFYLNLMKTIHLVYLMWHCACIHSKLWYFYIQYAPIFFAVLAFDWCQMQLSSSSLHDIREADNRSYFSSYCQLTTSCILWWYKKSLHVRGMNEKTHRSSFVFTSVHLSQARNFCPL